MGSVTDLSVFKFFDLNKYINLKTYHLAHGFEISVKVTKLDGDSDTEFIMILSHFPSLTYIAFKGKDAIDFLMKLPPLSSIEKDPNCEGEIYLSNMNLIYEMNEKKCRITLKRYGCELKRFALTIDEYKSLKGHCYDILMMFEGLDGETDCGQCDWD